MLTASGAPSSTFSTCNLCLPRSLSLSHTLYFSLYLTLSPLSPAPLSPQLATVCAAAAAIAAASVDALHAAGRAFLATGQRCVTTESRNRNLTIFSILECKKKKLQNGRQLYEIWYLPRTENYKSNWFPVPPVSHVWYGIVPLVVVPYIGRNRIKGPSLGLTDFSFNLHIVCALFRVHALTPRGWSALQLQRGGERVRKRERERSVECALWY